MSDDSRPGPSSEHSMQSFYVPAPGEPGGSPDPVSEDQHSQAPNHVEPIRDTAHRSAHTPTPPALQRDIPSWGDLPLPMLPRDDRPKPEPSGPTQGAGAPIFVPAPTSEPVQPLDGGTVQMGAVMRGADRDNAGMPALGSTGKGGRRLRRRGRPRFKARYLFVLIPLVPLLLLGAAALYGWSKFGDIKRVPVASLLTPTSGDFVNILLVGSDARAGVSGNRSDTIILLRVGPDGSKMMSIPRDLYVEIAETGTTQKINAAYNGGPGRLIQTVQQSLNVPVNRYMEVSFDTFGPIVDALGGIEINFAHQAFDKNSGFQVPGPGTHRLDGFNSLAFVRSRHYVEVIDGREVTDPTADLGRQQRQQLFLLRMFDKIGETKNPPKLAKVATALTGGVQVDDALGMFDAISLARSISSHHPESVVLPTFPDRAGQASILRLAPDADPVLAMFR